MERLPGGLGSGWEREGKRPKHWEPQGGRETRRQTTSRWTGAVELPLPPAEPKVRAERSGKTRGKCTPRLFKGRVIGAPVARANLPCEALRAGLQSLKRPLPSPLAYPPSQLLPLTPVGCGVVSEPGRGEKCNNHSYQLSSTHQVPGAARVGSNPQASPAKSALLADGEIKGGRN